MFLSKTLYHQNLGKAAVGQWGCCLSCWNGKKKSITYKSSSSNGSTERVSSKERLLWWSIKISVEDLEKFSI